MKSGPEGGVGGASVSSHLQILIKQQYSHVNVNLSIYTLIQQSSMPNTLIERPDNSTCMYFTMFGAEIMQMYMHITITIISYSYIIMINYMYTE